MKFNKQKNKQRFGFSYLFNTKNLKAAKADKFGYLNGIQYLMHHNYGSEAGIKNMCPWATPDCSALCFANHGHFPMGDTKKARILRSLMLLNDKETYLELLDAEINSLKRSAKRANTPLVLRMNGTSDKDFHKLGIYEKYSDVQFCEYTKNVGMVRKYVKGELPSNLHLTLSRSELNHDFCLEMLATGRINVAVPFFNGHPESFYGFPVVDGDQHDLRFLDPDGGHVVALNFKGWESKVAPDQNFVLDALEETETVEELEVEMA